MRNKPVSRGGPWSLLHLPVSSMYSISKESNPALNVSTSIGSSRDRVTLFEAVILFARLLPATLSARTPTMLTARLSHPSDDANCEAQRASASPALAASSRAPCEKGSVRKIVRRNGSSFTD